MATTGTTAFRNFIGGEWVDAASGETFESLSPATGETLGTFPRSSTEDVDRAVAAAREAWDDWRLTPAPERAQVLYRFAALLLEQKAELTDLMTREMGKVKAEAGGDVQEAVDMSMYMAGEGRRLSGQTTPSELRDKFMMSVRMPIGVVGAITPWNFPIAIPAWKICPAIVCGNTVVLKPAEDTPKLAQRFVDLLHESGLPEGVVQIVHGYGEEAGDALVKHPDVPVITFTGSRETGVLVTKNAADELKHVHLELGGKNAIIVMDDADVDLAVDGIIWSAFGTAGQRCTAASRVIVQRGVYEAVQQKLVAPAGQKRIGSPWGGGTENGPGSKETPRGKNHPHPGIGRTRARSSSPAARSRPTATSARASSTVRPSSPTSIRRCGSPRRRSSAPRPPSSRSPTSTRRSASRTGSSTASRPRSSRATSMPPSARCATSRPASRTSTPARSAPKCISRSAA